MYPYPTRVQPRDTIPNSKPAARFFRDYLVEVSEITQHYHVFYIPTTVFKLDMQILMANYLPDFQDAESVELHERPGWKQLFLCC